MYQRSKAVADMSLYYANPTLALDQALNMLGNVDIPDPGNAFMFLLESNAVMFTASALLSETEARKAHPILARDYGDLYHHMSDADYLDRFASPSVSQITMVIPIKTVQDLAIDENTGVRKLTIPSHTTFAVGGVTWATHRPIDFLVSNNGSVQVVYDMSYETPLMNTNTNMLDNWTVNNGDGVQLVVVIPIQQTLLTSFTEPVSPSTGFNVTRPLDGEYYHTRMYHRRAGGAWSEIRVTHSEQTYDASRPTVTAKVLETHVKFTLPSIYITANTIGDEIRVDLYTTRGELDFNFGDYKPDDFVATWRDLNNPSNKYVLPLAQATDLMLFSDTPVSGGRPSLTVDELRDRVIYRANDERARITYEELRFKVQDYGYKLLKAKDTITDRMFLCTRELPAPTDDRVTSPIGVRSGYVNVDSRDKLLDPAVLRITSTGGTLTDKAMFVEESGTVRLLSRHEVLALNDLPALAKADKFNAGNYLYTPYHYVMDTAEGLFVTRVYNFNACENRSRTWEYTNKAVDFRVSTFEVSVSFTDDVYRIAVRAEGPDDIEGFTGQLSFTDLYGHVYHTLATEVNRDGGVFDLVFELQSSLDVSNEDRVEVVNMFGVTNKVETCRIPIISTFDLYYVLNDGAVTAGLESTFDGLLDTRELSNPIGVAHERLELVLGERLTDLAARSKAVVVPAVPLTYHEDVQRRYDKTIYRRDSNGNLVWSIDADTNRPVFDVLHNTGERVYDENDNPVYLHRAGDVVMDANGVPMLEEHERVIWEISPLMLDARYKYVTDTPFIEYRDEVPVYIQGYLNDIAELKTGLMERTQLLLQPIYTIGKTMAKVDGNAIVEVDTALSFRLNYMLDDVGYGSSEIRDGIVRAAKAALQEAVNTDTIAMGVLTRKLMALGGEHALDVTVDNPIAGWANAALRQQGATYSIKTLMVVMSNGKLSLADDVEISFYTEQM